jgi:hypothetical protein
VLPFAEGSDDTLYAALWLEGKPTGTFSFLEIPEIRDVIRTLLPPVNRKLADVATWQQLTKLDPV